MRRWTLAAAAAAALGAGSLGGADGMALPQRNLRSGDQGKFQRRRPGGRQGSGGGGGGGPKGGGGGGGRSSSGLMFTWNTALPPLDSTALPAAPPSRGRNDTVATPFTKIYDGSSSPSSAQMALPSLRQRDDPRDETCDAHVCGPLQVTYTNRADQVERWLSDHVPSSPTVVGFDVESVPNAPWILNQASFEGPATVQVSTPHSALVVHLTREWGSRSSAACGAVGGLLSDPTVVKACTGIDDDMLELYRFNRNLRGRSRFDLGGLGSGVGSKNRVGLARLARAVLGVEMKKSKKLAVSNWSRFPLTSGQVAYAARDAWAGAAVMHALGQRHPGTFGPEAMMELLREERSMGDLSRRAARRRRARLQLKDIKAQFREYSQIDCRDDDDAGGSGSGSGRMPKMVRDEIPRLQAVMAETAPDGLIGFDAEPLGLAFGSKEDS